MNIFSIKFVCLGLILVLGLEGKTQNITDVKGLKQGAWKVYFPNTGVIKYKGQFINNTPIGLFIHNDIEGNKKASAIHHENGISYVKHYHSNGNLAGYGKYINKKKDSIWTFYNSNEDVKAKETYLNGKLNGVFANYYDGRKVALKGSYINGVKTGEWTNFFKSGKPKNKGTYIQGHFDGEYIEFYPSGKKQLVGYYQHAVKNGLWMLYNEDGSVRLYKAYKNGKVIKKQRKSTAKVAN